MLQLKYLLLLPVIALLASCVKNETINAAFSFSNGGNTVSGNNYKATCQVNQATGVHNFNGLFYVSNSGNYLQMQFTSVNYIVPGTYQLGLSYPINTSGTLNLYIDSVQYEGTTGNFQITQIDTVGHKVSGTFQFNAVNVGNALQTAGVTNGSFTNIGYTVQ